MEEEKFRSLWKKLEVLLSQLEITTQMWMVEKFIEEAKTSISGTMLTFVVPLFYCFIVVDCIF